MTDQRRLAGAAAVGVALGAAITLALAVRTDPKTASDTGFALGALVFGFAVTAWAGAIGFGDAMETMQRQLDTNSGWTKAGGRRAFAVLAAAGAGWIVGSVGTSIALGVG